ncbi:MAG: hypothetical protein M1828_005254 [Chrysothrix sp. TS-e1954]|nr:MAG: hypothetical protein M1828_005254 [Chrysothrix sp. TS-e1954]
MAAADSASAPAPAPAPAPKQLPQFQQYSPCHLATLPTLPPTLNANQTTSSIHNVCPTHETTKLLRGTSRPHDFLLREYEEDLRELGSLGPPLPGREELEAFGAYCDGELGGGEEEEEEEQGEEQVEGRGEGRGEEQGEGQGEEREGERGKEQGEEPEEEQDEEREKEREKEQEEEREGEQGEEREGEREEDQEEEVPRRMWKKTRRGRRARGSKKRHFAELESVDSECAVDGSSSTVEGDELREAREMLWENEVE